MSLQNKIIKYSQNTIIIYEVFIFTDAEKNHATDVSANRRHGMSSR